MRQEEPGVESGTSPKYGSFKCEKRLEQTIGNLAFPSSFVSSEHIEGSSKLSEIGRSTEAGAPDICPIRLSQALHSRQRDLSILPGFASSVVRAANRRRGYGEQK